MMIDRVKIGCWFTGFFMLMCLLASFPSISRADEVRRDASVAQQSFQQLQTDVILQETIENLLIVSGDKYVYNKNTVVESTDPESPFKSVAALPYPCRVNLLYRTYTQNTEAIPYPPGTKIVERITFIEEFETNNPDAPIKVYE